MLALAAGAALFAAACAEEPQQAIGPGVYPALAAAEVVTLGQPGPQDVPFGQALLGYSQELGHLHATDANVGVRVDAATHALATVLDRMPAGGAEPLLRRTAIMMRAEIDGHEYSVERTKRALAAAATALLGLAQTLYRDEPDIAARLREFAGSVAAIDAQRDPPDHAAVITALLRAERALGVIYAADVVPPLAGSRPH
jgi:hypothetical protein